MILPLSVGREKQDRSSDHDPQVKDASPRVYVHTSQKHLQCLIILQQEALLTVTYISCTINPLHEHMNLLFQCIVNSRRSLRRMHTSVLQVAIMFFNKDKVMGAFDFTDI